MGYLLVIKIHKLLTLSCANKYKITDTCSLESYSIVLYLAFIKASKSSVSFFFFFGINFNLVILTIVLKLVFSV